MSKKGFLTYQVAKVKEAKITKLKKKIQLLKTQMLSNS